MSGSCCILFSFLNYHELLHESFWERGIEQRIFRWDIIQQRIFFPCCSITSFYIKKCIRQQTNPSTKSLQWPINFVIGICTVFTGPKSSSSWFLLDCPLQSGPVFLRLCPLPLPQFWLHYWCTRLRISTDGSSYLTVTAIAISATFSATIPIPVPAIRLYYLLLTYLIQYNKNTRPYQSTNPNFKRHVPVYVQ
jgi:hypothetical protein